LIIIGFFGGLGMTTAANVKWNIISLWSLPFLVVGTGCDMLFIIACAIDGHVRADKASLKDPQLLGKVLNSCQSPLTMITIVNFAMFAVMSTSDLPGIYETAYTAMFSIILLYILTVCTFPAMLAIDIERRNMSMTELGFRRKVPAAETYSWPKYTAVLCERLYMKCILTHVGRAVVTLVTVTFVVISGIKMAKLPMGLQLEEFFQFDTAPQLYFQDRVVHFPFWPIQMTLGELNYSDPTVQVTVCACARVCEFARWAGRRVHLQSLCSFRSSSSGSPSKRSRTSDPHRNRTSFGLPRWLSGPWPGFASLVPPPRSAAWSLGAVPFGEAGRLPCRYVLSASAN
jgi:hypothetical protein